ncbi:hypothetical protein CH278_21190 [Rhodococcus sp. 05-2254-5]|uniref:hypothetical protein n=1 Tax=unclassified Rhodococcus (in: high G+C Gram-positive bacteria) TaxID=192944 RepID=UPI000B9B1A27|nr:MULTISPECIES: hypothetical protein [unclassified Rhodococcus (in: high G+C Gram-positive bacteria)]OZE29323.1 hypothetical protein CH278_21190 [Rhodococcus sp. 05-2254-5]OZE53542.1 hypothetical protein CH269_20440 [Rhodococcus sp. 05-2254-1]
MSAFTKAARFVGDLDDDFYADELQRDIWNEASAVGLQCLLWIGFISAAILPYAAGVTGAWIAIGIIVTLLAVSYVVIGYSRARGVEVQSAQQWLRARFAVFIVLYLLGVGGAFVRLLGRYVSGDLGSVWIGAAIGVPLGIAGAVVGVKRKQRKQRKAEHAAELAEQRAFDTDE